MFHVELRQFPHVARAFNLNRAKLEERIVRPWLAGESVELDDRRWARDRARLKIYEGPELRSDQIGMGRGWGNVTKTGHEVTAEVIEQAADHDRSAIEDVSERVLSRCRRGAVTLEEVTALAGDRALAEQVIVELLREGSVKIVAG